MRGFLNGNIFFTTCKWKYIYNKNVKMSIVPYIDYIRYILIHFPILIYIVGI